MYSEGGREGGREGGWCLLQCAHLSTEQNVLLVFNVNGPKIFLAKCSGLA